MVAVELLQRDFAEISPTEKPKPTNGFGNLHDVHQRTFAFPHDEETRISNKVIFPGEADDPNQYSSFVKELQNKKKKRKRRKKKNVDVKRKKKATKLTRALNYSGIQGLSPTRLVVLTGLFATYLWMN